MSKQAPEELDEPALVAALVIGAPPVSRNRHYALMSSALGRRAQRRAAFLRSIARDIDRVCEARGAVTLERTDETHPRVQLSVHHPEFARRAWLTEFEVSLLTRAFPRVAEVFEVGRRTVF